jgi:uncharacterized protein (DUF58 family)
VFIEVIDELPIQFQKRDFSYKMSLVSHEVHDFNYDVRPVERGEYFFGNLNIYASSVLKIVKRKYQFQNEQLVTVYPSFIQMQKYDFLAISNNLTAFGLKKIRKIGNTQEFEQIKDYVQGDDFRKVNWKATAKRGALMVNQYQDEKSQPIYSLIDIGRVMKMPFEELKLLDYAINSTLVFSNIALRKGDKAGLITFSDKIGSMLMAERSTGQLRKIQEALYNQKSLFKEASFELLYQSIRKSVRSRSLLMLFSNFETEFSLKRAIPVLRKLNQKHVLVVVIFENSQLQDLAYQQSKNTFEVYQSTVAERMLSVKSKMARELRQNGIQTIVTLPEDLSVKTINKYLELKAKGSI